MIAEETDFLDDPEDVSKIPKFGNSTTPYEEVHEFYAYWMAFSTNKSKYILFILFRDSYLPHWLSGCGATARQEASGSILGSGKVLLGRLAKDVQVLRLYLPFRG